LVTHDLLTTVAPIPLVKPLGTHTDTFKGFKQSARRVIGNRKHTIGICGFIVEVAEYPHRIGIPVTALSDTDADISDHATVTVPIPGCGLYKPHSGL
jgi:hypothetical protein